MDMQLSNTTFADINPGHLCAKCNNKLDAHATAANPTVPFGCPSGEFPRWPTTVKDEAKAGRLYDKRVAAYWKASKSTFVPKR